MESQATNRYSQRGQSPTFAKPAAIVIGIVALTCAVLVMTGNNLSFQTADATASGANNASVAAGSGTPGAPHAPAETRPAGYFPDQYLNAATRVEDQPPTF